MDEVSASWTLFWIVAPYVVGPVFLVWLGRWMLRRTSPEGFTEEWASHHEDVAYWERELPEMRDRRG